MSIQNREVPFSFHSHSGEALDFTGIRELGFNERGAFIVSAWTTPANPGGPRGSYFTAPPISPLAYRRTNRTATGFVRERRRLILRDDWGNAYTIAAPADVLDALVAECIANEIPRASGPEGRRGT
jgi:hypothetical protein